MCIGHWSPFDCQCPKDAAHWLPKGEFADWSIDVHSSLFPNSCLWHEHLAATSTRKLHSRHVRQTHGGSHSRRPEGPGEVHCNAYASCGILIAVSLQQWWLSMHKCTSERKQCCTPLSMSMQVSWDMYGTPFADLSSAERIVVGSSSKP